MEIHISDQPDKRRRLRLPSLRWTVFAVLLAGFALAWVFGPALLQTRFARNRFEADVAACRARGEKVLKDDFAHPSIPAEVNAAHFINDAASGIRMNEEELSFFFDLPNDRRLNPQEVQKVRLILQANKAAFDNAHLARYCSQVDWQLDLSPSPLIGKLQLRYLNPSRELAELIALKVHFEHQQGDDAAAVESLRDLVFLSRALDAQSVIVSHLVSIGAMSIATEACRNIAANLRVTDVAAPRDSAATREQVKQLTSDLLAEAEYRRGITDAWQGERMQSLDSALFVARSASIFRRGEVYVEADRVLREANVVLAAAQAPSWQRFNAILSASLEPPEDASHKLSHLLCSRWRQVPVHEFRSRAERGAAALALTIRLYAIDHGNALPGSLDLLVPTYLKSLPPDPFAADGAPLLYRSTVPAAVYSVNEDGIDEGGKVDPERANIWAGPDAVFLLHSDWDD